MVTTMVTIKAGYTNNLKFKELKGKSHLDESVDEEFYRILRASISLDSKEFTVMADDKGLEPRIHDNNFLKLINDYLKDKINCSNIID